MNQTDRNKQAAYAIANSNTTEKAVLIVEDDRTHRNMMEKILRECAFQVYTAENGIEALSILEKGFQFDLVIMDWDMPELDGLETVREIRARERKKGKPRMPVIAFTGNRNPGDREKCLAAGMDGYLPKDSWMSEWRSALIDSLQSLVSGTFELSDVQRSRKIPNKKWDFDLDAFDMETLEQSAALLKDDLTIAVDEYLEDAAAYIRDISQGVENNDAEVAARGSHPLKSNSKGFGLTAVSQIAEAINTTTREGNMEGVDSLLDQLREAFKRAETRLRDVIQRVGY